MIAAADPSRYWSEVLDEGVVAAMAQKYRTTLSVLADSDRMPVSPEALRDIAKRWPGALREAQLVSPIAYRLRCELTSARAVARQRDAWRARGAAWLPLWADLHRLLQDQLAWRRAGGRGDDPSGFLRSLSTSARSRWPSEAVVVQWGRMSSRHAERWLAMRAGLSAPALDGLLFDRGA